MAHHHKLKSADLIGSLAGGLCLIHCLITPFIFVAKACSATCCSSAPAWWHYIDYLFIAVSFVAIYLSVRNMDTKWVKTTLWTSWISLVLFTLNESFDWYSISQEIIHIPAFAIIGLHLYHMKFCYCTDESCKVHGTNKN